MIKNLEIQDFEDKKTNAGKSYTRFKTSDGWMSCFDSDECTKLKQLNKKIVKIETQESISNKGTEDEKIFYNIKKCHGESENETQTASDAVKPGVTEKTNVSKGSYNPNSMYVSYAKDIFCVLIDKMETREFDGSLIMKNCIELVKQAKEAFE